MRWRIIARNIGSNWASYLVTAVIGFFLTPVILHSLGTTGYGLWTLVLSLTGYFGLLDLGIRSSVGRFVARYIALEDEDKVNRTVSTACVILAVGGMCALLGTVVVAIFFFGNFHVEPALEAAGRTALIITGFNVALALPLGVFTAVLVALERYDVLSGVTILAELTRAALVLGALRLGYGLPAIAGIALLLTALQYSASALFARSLHRSLRISFRLLDRATVKEIFGFSIYRFIWIVAIQLIFYSNSVVIGVFLGAGAITYYAIASSLINYGRNIVSVVTDALYPTATRLDARRDMAGLQELLFLGTRLALMVTLPICIGFIFLGRQFITLWMGELYIFSAFLLALLTISQFGSMSQYASTLILAGMAKHRMLAYLVLAEGVVNVVLSCVLVRKMGVTGVALGAIIPHFISMTIIVPLYTSRIVGLKAAEHLARAYVRPLISAIPAAAVGWAFAAHVQRPTWLLFALEAAAISAAFALTSVFVCFDSKQRAGAMRRVYGFARRDYCVHET